MDEEEILETAKKLNDLEESGIVIIYYDEDGYIEEVALTEKGREHYAPLIEKMADGVPAIEEGVGG